MQTKVVLFDLDGTLIDSLSLINQTYVRVFTELNLPLENSDVMRWVGLPLKDIAQHFAKDQEEDFLNLYQQYYFKEHDNHISLFPGTLEMLDRLKKQSIKTGLVTSKGKIGTDLALKRTNLEKYMDVVITAQDIIKPKPQPEPILEALKRFRVSPFSAVYVGDSHFDIMAGQKAGVKALGVTWGAAGKEEMCKIAPDGILENWEELDDFL